MHTGFEWARDKLEEMSYPTSVIILTIVALFSIWSNRFLPMQDYPQHLFIAFAAATSENTAFNWQQYYDINLKLTPYSLSYIFIGTLANVVSIEAAGKALISLILGLYAAFALIQKRADTGSAPWAFLLLFPVFFNQIFYFGFLNYLLALPILLFALRDADRVAKVPFSALSLLRHFTLLLLLFLAHPFVLVLYIVFGGWFLVFSLGDRAAFKRLFSILLTTGLIFIAWYLQLPSHEGYYSFTWAPLLEGSLPFFLLMFTGMRYNGGIEPATTTLWLVVFMSLAHGAYQSRAKFRLNRLYLALAVSALALFFILPFHFGNYAVFNFRLAPVVYLFVLVLISTIPLPRANVALVAVASLVLLLIANSRHSDYSAETASIVPILGKMMPNARVFPVYNDRGTAVLDSGFFFQVHAHDHFYYHTLVGGGVSPSLFVNAMLPIQFKAGMRPPASTASLAGLLQAYDYVLIRKPLREDVESLSGSMTLVEQSVDWALFANPDSVKRGQ